MAKRARNPYAVCNAQMKRTGKKWSKAKFERCVRGAKRK